MGEAGGYKLFLNSNNKTAIRACTNNRTASRSSVGTVTLGNLCTCTYGTAVEATVNIKHMAAQGIYPDENERGCLR